MQALLIGDHEYREFVEPGRWLGERTELSTAVNCEAGLSRLAEPGTPPRLIVFAQSRPGQFSQADAERIHAAAPLARLVALLGSWCEGETRSGHPWPGVMRIYWHQWLPRMSVLLERSRAQQRAGWDLPRTATDAEILLAASSAAPLGQRGLAIISARRFTTFSTLADACQLAGLSAVWFSPDRPAAQHGVALSLWDSCGWGPFEAHQLAHFTAQVAPAATIALLDFPRLAEQQEVVAAGAAAVVSKPFLLEDLLWHVDSVLGGIVSRTAHGEAA